MALLTVLLLVQPILAQSSPGVMPPSFSTLSSQEAAQTAGILGLDSKVRRLRSLRSATAGAQPVTLEELTLRQELLEAVQYASLEVDGVLAELSSERNRLGDMLVSLQSRRDRTVGRLNTAALIAGSGLSAAVSATQFHSLSNTTQNVGDAIGIGSGVGATVLSILALRSQRGPSSSVSATPNMLAPLLGGTPVLSTWYPPAVMQYLQAVPVGADAKQGTRLDRLKAEWTAAGRLDASAVTGAQRTRAVTTSSDPAVKVTIDDLTARIAMLGDVMGTVSLMKRDLGMLMGSLPPLSRPE